MRVTVPDLRGRSQNDATAAIQDLKLHLGPFGERESSEPRGTVVAQDPPAGTVVDVGALIAIWVAVPTPPPAPQWIVVPRVVESSLQDAFVTLRAAGLQPGSVGQTASSARTGSVTFQSVAAGTQVAPGTAIDLIVATPLAAWWSTVPLPWLGASALLGLAVAAVRSIQRTRRNRIVAAPGLVAHADEGIQTIPGDHDLAGFEVTLEARRDRGSQTLDGPDVFVAGYWTGKQELSW